MMKAISIWQPYASFMANHLKCNETRSWATKFRGNLAICSAKRNWRPGEFGDFIEWFVARSGDLWLLDNQLKPENEKEIFFPKGYVVCVVNVFDCQPVEKIKVMNLEREFGNYSVGRFAWMTSNCRPLKKPVPVIGRQGFFNLPPDIEAKVRSQL